MHIWFYGSETYMPKIKLPEALQQNLMMKFIRHKQ